MKTTLIATILAIMMLPFAAATNWVLPNGGSFSSVGGGAYTLSDNCYGGHCVVVDTESSGSDYEASATIELLGGLVGNEAGICARTNSQGFGYCYSLSWGGSTQTNQYTMLGHFWPQQINGVYTYNPSDLKPGTGVDALPGNVYNIKIKTQGNTLSGKAWPQGSSEPSSWNAVHTDAQNRYSSGSIGFYTYYTQAKIGNIQINGNALPEPSQPCPSAPDMKIYPTTQSVSPGSVAEYKVVIKNNNPSSCTDYGNNVFWVELLAPDTNTDNPTEKMWTHALNGQKGKTDGMLMKWYDLYVAPNSQQTFLLKLKVPPTASSGKRELRFVTRAQENTHLRSQDPLIGYVQVTGTAIQPIVEEPHEQICIAVMQPAINPVTNECKVFSTPCAVPSDWKQVHECPSESVTPVVPEPIAPTEPTVPSCDNGCRTNDHCLPFGTRLVQEDKPVYCGITQQFNEQQAEGASCQNDYECSSNSCASGRCVDLAAKIEEQQNVLQKILHFLSTIFGKRIEPSAQVEEPSEPTTVVAQIVQAEE